jgi:hypothetical protein
VYVPVQVLVLLSVIIDSLFKNLHCQCENVTLGNKNGKLNFFKFVDMLH